MSVRIVAGEISAKDATTRTVLPTEGQGRWPPFERVAETIASSSRRFPPHRHSGVEVLTYIIEGAGAYEYGTDPARAVAAGSVQLMTAPESVAHTITAGKGQTVRWFAAVAVLSPESRAGPRVQFGQPADPDVAPETTVVQPLVGPSTPVQSALGLECSTIRFLDEGTLFRRIGHKSLAVVYAISGRGTVGNEAIEAGEGALVEDSSGIAVHGEPGCRLIQLSLPRPP